MELPTPQFEVPASLADNSIQFESATLPEGDSGILSRTSEELDDRRPKRSVEEMAEELSDKAWRVAEGKGPAVAARRLTAKEGAWLGISSTGVSMTYNAITTVSSWEMPTAAQAVYYPALIAIAGETLSTCWRVTRARPDVMQVSEDGYSLQCLKLKPPEDDSPQGQAVAVAVHPRSYPNGQSEPSELTRQRLAAALEVIAEARKDSDEVSLIIIPGSVAQKAGLNQGRGRYGDTVDSLTGYPHSAPYSEDEPVLVVPAWAAGDLAARLAEGDILARQVFAELSRRYPNAGPALRQDNNGLRTVLLGLLRQSATLADGRVFKLDRQALGAGHIIKEARDTITSIIVEPGGYNPLLQTAIVGSDTAESSQTLRGATAAEAERLRAGEMTVDKVSDLALIRVGLDAAEASDQERRSRRTRAGEESPEASDMPLLGDTPDVITVVPASQPVVWLRSFGRIAAGAALLGSAGVAALSLHAIATSDTSTESVATRDRPQPKEIYKVENHGLVQQSAYWSQETRYRYEGGKWWGVSSSEPGARELEVPRYLSDKQVPHATVQTYSRNSWLALPVQDNTAIGAVRAKDAAGENLTVKTYQERDGQLGVNIDNWGSIYHLEYDLLASPLPVIQATKPISVPQGATISQDALTAFGKSNAAQTAEGVREDFIYDDAQLIKDALATVQTPGEYVDYLGETGRCQCDQCNTLVALVESQNHPKAKLAHVTGYWKPALKERGYLGRVRHAWLADGDGSIVDATAKRMDAASVPAPVEAAAELERAWSNNRRLMLDEAPKTLPWGWLLGGMAASGLLVAELRTGTMRRAMRNHIGELILATDLHRNGSTLSRQEAVNLLAWHAFGGPTSMPRGKQVEGLPLPDKANIPTSSLQEVANGNFRGAGELTTGQRRILAGVAKDVLFGRRFTGSGHELQVQHAVVNFDLG